MAITIQPYKEEQCEVVLALSMNAWAPVFEELKPAVAPYVYDAFYPHGWRIRQSVDIENFLKSDPCNVWVATEEDKVLGWIGLRLHSEDSMGEIFILAVDPDAQRQGVARALIDCAFETFRNAKLKIVMVETGDDPGHAPSRATYESVGFERWPVARYFKEL